MNKYICFSLICCFFLACTNDMVDGEEMECAEEYTYEGEVAEIIDASCAYSGCHISGSFVDDYSTYNSLREVVQSGSFENRVLNLRNMPPQNATGPTELTEEQLNILSCWIDQGFPE